MAYIDLVLCKHSESGKLFLFEAPPFSYLAKGDEVIVETRHGETSATVRMSYTVEAESKAYDFIVEAAGATHPLKRVLKECQYKELIYKEEENGNADKDE